MSDQSTTMTGNYVPKSPSTTTDHNTTIQNTESNVNSSEPNNKNTDTKLIDPGKEKINIKLQLDNLKQSENKIEEKTCEDKQQSDNQKPGDADWGTEDDGLTLGDEKLYEWKDVFSLFDNEGDGSINAKDLGLLMRALGANPSQSKLNEIIEEFEREHDGYLDFPQFVKLMKRECLPPDNEAEIKKAFQVFDIEGNGKISVSELKTVLTTLGETLTNDEVEELIKVCFETIAQLMEFRKLKLTKKDLLITKSLFKRCS